MIQIIKSILPNPLAVAASVAVPTENWQWWHKYNNNNCIKYGSVDHLRFPSACKTALVQLAIKASEHLILPEDVFPDLDFHAGGMHMLPPGGWLGGHYDAEYHPIFQWERVGSLVWFANQKWEQSWGGELIIGDEIIRPEFNTAVYFDTKNTWHEVLKVIGPEPRKTFALFFWKEIEQKPECGKINSRFEK